MKLSLTKKITIWFIVILIVSIVLYGLLILGAYRFMLRGEGYLESLKDSIGRNEIIDQQFIDRFREWEKNKPPPRFFPEATIITPAIFLRIGLTITGGALIIIILAASGGFLILRRSLRQIGTITSNVKEIDEKRLHLRINMKGKDPISKMARTFDDMLDKIEVSFKSQKHFIQNASHELNTPLTVIKTRIDSLKQKKTISKEEYSKALDMIDSEIMRLSKITEELLILSRLEENGKTDFKTIDLKTIIDKIEVLFKSRIESAGSKMVIDVGKDVRISGNEGKIQQLIFNLVDNAAKYSIPKDKIELSVKALESGEKALIEVSNHSEHIDEEVISNIFERFYKGKKQVHVRGYGLGLSIAKKIVEIHDGKISAEYSKNDKKIKIKVLLPSSG